MISILQRRKTTKMRQSHTILSGKNAMSKCGISRVCFDTFSSKDEYGITFTDNYNQSRSIDFQCCSFTSKERDEETGYGYFDARYMDHELMTMWLSVDPLADKYPGISPYAYCAWNPVKLVDPDGRDIWQLDNQGNVVDCIENSEFDQLQIVDDYGNVLCSSDKYDFGTISELCIEDGKSNTTFSVCGQSNAKSVFEFLADNYTEANNRSLEWGWATLANSTGMDNIIGTTHSKQSNGLFNILINNNYSLEDYTHNHPSGDPRPSTFIDYNYLRGDLASASKHPNILFFTYTPVTGYRQYTGNGVCDLDLLNFTAGLQNRTFDWSKLGRRNIK